MDEAPHGRAQATAHRYNFDRCKAPHHHIVGRHDGRNPDDRATAGVAHGRGGTPRVRSGIIGGAAVSWGGCRHPVPGLF